MNILNLITGAAAPVIAGKLAGMFGVPESVARKVVAAGIPVLLAALMKKSATPGGADAIAVALGGMSNKNPLDALASGDPAQASAAASSGSNLLASLLGGDAGTLASKLGSYAGVDAAQAGPLLGMTGALALGGLKKAGDSQGLDAAALMRMLDGEKSEIAAAIPADFARALDGTGIVGAQFLQAPAAPIAPAPAARVAPAAAAAPVAPRPAAPAAAPTPRPTVTKAPPPPPAKSGMMRWLLPLLAVALLIWLATQFFGRTPEAPVVEAPAPAAEPAAPVATAPEPAAPAATETAAANPLVVNGVDLGATVTGVLSQITGTLGGVTDTASAQTAVTRLTEAGATLATVQDQAGALSTEGKSALAAMVSSALPAIQAASDKLSSDSAIGGVMKTALDAVLARLTALAA